MIRKRVWLLLAIFFMLTVSHVSYAELPVCSNRVISEVTKRIGCTVGDYNCWLSKGGMCTDYIQKMAGQPGKVLQLHYQVRPEDVRKGDVAQFTARSHYVYVDSVVKDKNGKPIAINVSEYNYGTCWVDRAAMVTDQYKQINRRSGILLRDVDGGFWRHR